jgi:PAS domain S-box-containing protein
MTSHIDTQLNFLSGRGKTASLIADYNWGATPLGKIDDWPSHLKTMTSVILNAEVPMVLLWGSDGYLIYNDAYAEFAGARHPEILGLKAVDAWPEVADFNRNVIATGLSGQTLSYTNQQLRLTRNHTPEDVWLNLHYSPVMDERSQPQGVMAIVIDMTDQVKAEQELAFTRSQLDSALAIGLVSTWTWDIPNDIVTGDDNLAKNFGVSPKVLKKGLPLSVFVDAIHPSDRQRVADAITHAIDKCETFEEQYRTITADNSQRWVIARGQVTCDDDNQPISFVGVIVDITESKETQQEMIEAKEKFDALFNSNIVAIAMAKFDGTVVQANKTFLNLFGYTQKDIKKGLNSKQLTAPVSHIATTSIYDSLKQTGEAEPTEKMYVKKDGTIIPTIVGAAKLPNSDDTFIAFILDVSENERLKELNNIKDEFIALASHQLRTPASAARQYIGVLLEEYAGPLNPKQREYLTIADNANNRQLAILDDLLKTAQIDAKTLSLELQPHDLVALVRKVLGDYTSTMNDKNQKLVFKTDSQKIIVPLDETQMSTCIANLIENASKYSPDNTQIKIEIKKSTKCAELIVADQGIGIDSKDYDKIFGKFTRLNTISSESIVGSGLGLYLVKRIVDIHKGQIKIKSNVGTGTRFTVRLPYDQS